jgi:putative heme-binding domain-containing protein
LRTHSAALDLQGDGTRGRAVFESNCQGCHAVAGAGHNTGPDLASLRHRTKAELLAGIIDPNAALEPQYISYELETLDGQSHSGLIRSTTPDRFSIAQGNGILVEVPRTNVARLRASNFSMMPEGLEQNLDPQALADLLTFLIEARGTPSP